MFASKTYVKRRTNLMKNMKSGILLFPGNVDVAMNYPANPIISVRIVIFCVILGWMKPIFLQLLI